MRPESNLEKARRHVAEAIRRIDAQRARLVALEKRGLEVADALKTLETFEASLAAMRVHLAAEEREAADPAVGRQA